MNIKDLKTAGRINHDAIEFAKSILKAGKTKKYIDNHIQNYITSHGGKPAFLGFNGYPASSCISVNEEAVHGIPNDYIFKEDDLVTIDTGTIYNECYVDSAQTILIGLDENKLTQLILNRDILYFIMQQIKPSTTLFDIAELGDKSIIDHPYNNNHQIIPHLGGHFCGSALHVPPFVPHTAKCVPLDELEKWKQATLKPGDVLCIEPIITNGSIETEILSDGWTVVTKDGSIVTHEEHTVLITEKGFEILT